MGPLISFLIIFIILVVLPRFLSRAKISQEHCDELHQYIEDFLG